MDLGIAGGPRLTEAYRTARMAVYKASSQRSSDSRERHEAIGQARACFVYSVQRTHDANATPRMSASRLSGRRLSLFEPQWLLRQELRAYVDSPSAWFVAL